MENLPNYNVIVHAGSCLHKYPELLAALDLVIENNKEKTNSNLIFTSKENANIACEQIESECSIKYYEYNENNNDIMDTRKTIADLMNAKIDLLVVFKDAIEHEFSVRWAVKNNIQIAQLHHTMMKKDES